MKNTVGELLGAQGVREFLTQAAPQIMEGPAAGYVTSLTLEQL